MKKTELLINALKAYDISLSDTQLAQFESFEKFLKDYNSHTNLVSSKDIELVWEKHFVDSIAFLKYLNPTNVFKLIDIGSGGGFPVIPEAIILTNANIFALDSTSKKTSFLEKASAHLSLNNLSVINDRAEELAHRKTFRENFDIVTARAVGNLAQISELALPFLKQGGNFIAYKSTKLAEEIAQAKNTIALLGGEIQEVFEYEINSDENFKRNLVLIKKINPTPIDFPRSFSAIKNKPL